VVFVGCSQEPFRRRGNVLPLVIKKCIVCKRTFTPLGKWDMVCDSCYNSNRGLDSEEGGG